MILLFAYELNILSIEVQETQFNYRFNSTFESQWHTDLAKPKGGDSIKYHLHDTTLKEIHR